MLLLQLPTLHGGVTLLKLCFNMSLYCFFPLTPVYTQSAIELPSILWAYPDEWSCAVVGITSTLVDFLRLHC